MAGYYTPPPRLVNGQYMSASQVATYYTQNINVIWDFARAPTPPMKTLYGAWQDWHPPYVGAIPYGGTNDIHARVRHKLNWLRYRIVVTSTNWAKSHPTIKLLVNGVTIKDFAGDLPGSGTAVVTLDGAVALGAVGVAVGQFYNLALRYGPPNADDVSGTIHLVRWYEADSVTGETGEGSGTYVLFDPPPDYQDGQVPTAGELNVRLGDNIETLYGYARRAQQAFAVVNERWHETANIILGYGPDSYSLTHYHIDHHRLPYLKYGLVFEWNFDYPLPRCDLLINNVVHDLSALVPISQQGGIYSVTLEGQIDVSNQTVGDSYLIEFRHSPPYPISDPLDPGVVWYQAPGHIALHYLYEGDDESGAPPAGWTTPTPPVHLDYVNAARFNTLFHDMVAINAICGARINPPAGEWRWWEIDPRTAPGWKGNGLVIPHRARWLYYETPPETLQDTRPRLLPIWAAADSDQAVTLAASRDGMTKFDLDQVDWLTPGMLYRLLDVRFALEDDD